MSGGSTFMCRHGVLGTSSYCEGCGGTPIAPGLETAFTGIQELKRELARDTPCRSLKHDGYCSTHPMCEHNNRQVSALEQQVKNLEGYMLKEGK